MKAVKKVKWDPIVAKLAEYNVKQQLSVQANSNAAHSRVKANWVAVVEKRRSKEEFQEFIHELFHNDGPKVKYQNPDSWRRRLKKDTDDNT